jgi:hypothetical protein
MIPSDKSMLPPLHISISFFTAFGIATAGCANLIHNKPFFMGNLNHFPFVANEGLGPSRIIIGGVLGAISGYILHNASERTHDRNLASQAYRERYQEYMRTHKGT